MSALAVLAALKVRTEIGYRSFLGDSHPSVTRFDGFIERFGGGLPLLAVWDCSGLAVCDDALDPASLKMAYRVARSMMQVPHVRAVDSPATTPLLVDDVFGPELRRFVEFGEPVLGDHDLLAASARKHPMWQGALISDDATTGAIVIHLASSASDASISVYEQLRKELKPYEDEGFEFWFIGGPVEFVVAGIELSRDTKKLIPLMVLLIGAVLWPAFGSLTLSVVVLCVSGLAVLWAQGLLGALGWPQTSIGEILAPTVLAVGACDAIHLVAHIETSGAGSIRSRTLNAAQEVFRPCLVTSLTTAAGLLAFSISDLRAFAQFGVVAAVAVMIALLLTFTLLPLVLVHLPEGSFRGSASTESQYRHRFLSALDAFSRRHAHKIVGLAFVTLAVAGVGLQRVRIESSFEELYGENSQVVRWADSVAEKLRRPDTLEVDLVAPYQNGRALTRADLELIEDTAANLAAIEGLGPSRSIASLLVGSDRTDPGAALKRLEKTAPKSLQGWLSKDQRHVRIAVDADKLEQQPLARAISKAEQIAANLTEGWTATITGPLAVVHDMVGAIRSTQLSSFTLAFGLVFVLLAFFLRSPLLTLAGMVPTALPALSVLGFMGWAGMRLDAGGAMVAAVVLGIAVDDTVHLCAEFNRLRKLGDPPAQAMRGAVLHVGRAVITTSVALVAGFMSLSISSWGTVARFGVIASVSIAVALVATLCILPALIYAFGSQARRL